MAMFISIVLSGDDSVSLGYLSARSLFSLVEKEWGRGGDAVGGGKQGTKMEGRTATSHLPPASMCRR